MARSKHLVQHFLGPVDLREQLDEDVADVVLRGDPFQRALRGLA